MTDLRIAGKFQLQYRIGRGAFGEIYRGVNLATGEDVAIKLEPIDAKPPQLLYESKLYKILVGGVGIPYIYHYGPEGEYNVLVMDLLGPSLEDLFTVCNRQFSLKTTLMLADQMITRIEFLHLKNFLHRDIKPDNFLIGLGRRKTTVYIVDFGLAKRYMVGNTHIPYREHKSLTGTARYCSINTHLGLEQSRRDDLEALAYVFLYFLRGSLPWQGLKANTKRQKYEKILEKKMSSPIEALTRGYPTEFAAYLHYTRALRFDDRPDYAYLRKIFRELFVREGYSYDYIFDWTLLGIDIDKYHENKLAGKGLNPNGEALKKKDSNEGSDNAAAAGGDDADADEDDADDADEGKGSRKREVRQERRGDDSDEGQRKSERRSRRGSVRMDDYGDRSERRRRNESHRNSKKFGGDFHF